MDMAGPIASVVCVYYSTSTTGTNVLPDWWYAKFTLKFTRLGLGTSLKVYDHKKIALTC